MRIYAGTSGFSYPAWRGSFYPADLAADAMLAHYATRLPAVEVNNTFYRMPKPDVVARWRAQVDAQFRFVVKASRAITHTKKLLETQSAVAFLQRSLSELGDNLGGVLLQLPKWVRKDLALLESFLDSLPAGLPPVFEFAHASWSEPDARAALRARGVGVCANDEHCEGLPELHATGPFGYLRLRQPAYPDATLRELLQRVRDTDWQHTFVFFKHEDAGAGPALAARLLEFAG